MPIKLDGISDGVDPSLQTIGRIFRLIMNRIPLCIAHVGRDQAYTMVNRAYEEYFGIPRVRIEGRLVREILSAEVYEEARQHIEEALKGETARFEQVVFHPRFGHRRLDIQYLPDFGRRGAVQGFFAIIEDVTDRRHAEEALKESHLNLEREVQERTRRLEEANLSLKRSEDRYRALFRYNPIETVIVDREGRVTGYNRAKLNSGGRLPEIGCVMYKDYASRHEIDMHAELMDCIRNGISKDFPEQRYRDKYLHVRMSPFSEGAIITSIDVTERTRAEEAIKRSRSELKSLSSRLLSAQEEERRRIARELHDGVCQFLAFVKIAVVNAQRRIAPDSAAYECLEEIPSQIREAIEDVRRLVTNLRPSILDNLGLLPTVSNLCQRLKEMREGILVDRRVTILERDVPDALKIVVFRTLQEALNNVAKHSGADRVGICLEKKDGGIELCVRDNGCGFEPEEKAFTESSKGGIGLSSMRERIELSGGRFELTASFGKGTVIKAFWPAGGLQR